MKYRIKLKETNELIPVVRVERDGKYFFVDESGNEYLSKMDKRGYTVECDISDEAKEIGQTIRQLREENNLTQDDLGEIIAMAHKTICQLETGVTPPNIETLYRILDQFGKKIIIVDK